MGVQRKVSNLVFYAQSTITVIIIRAKFREGEYENFLSQP